jgi:hypothetical protein
VLQPVDDFFAITGVVAGGRKPSGRRFALLLVLQAGPPGEG